MATNGLMGLGALDKIRAWHAAALDQVSYPMIVIGALLRHLRALTAPADEEAMGRELWKAVPVITPVRWEDLEPWLRDRYRSHALKCHAIGHAGGALSREGEVAALRSELSMAHSDHVAACDQRDTEIARLTAELAEATARREEAEALVAGMSAAVVSARADGAREERERILRKLKRIGYPDAVAAFERAKTRRARGGR